MIKGLKFLLTHVSLYLFNIFILYIDSRGYNPNRKIFENTPKSFNPITNQPLRDYQVQQTQIRKEQEINEFNNHNPEMEKYNKIDNFQQMKGNQREQTPMEYNPYKRPYSLYQGHP